MRFRLLGPLEIVAGEQRLVPARRRERWLLAVLLLEVGRVVSTEQLVGLLWEDDPPRAARRAVQSHVARIRALLASSGEAATSTTVTSRHGGYVLATDPRNIDVHRFKALVRQGQAAADAAERWNLLGEALQEWQGPVLDGDAAESLRVRLCADLEELRLAAVEAWAAAGLALGRHAELIPELSRQIACQPTRERLAELQMHALHRAGRTVDALAVYRQVRDQLAEALGLDPGAALRALHEALLRGEAADPALTRTTAPTEPPWQVPRQVPAPPQLFTGRSMELADLAEIHDASTVVISAIDGMAGVGKTALAVHAAHQMVDRYPDGQLFIDLHGYTEGVAPVGPAEALDRLLRVLGVAGERIPAGLEERAGLYRSRLAERRIVIVLDNAATEAQVTPLLPGAPGCLVLVTSRRRLAGLDQTHTLSLDTLPPADAVTLLRRSVGESRLADQPADVVAELVDLCGQLPLAIRIAAARLRAHPAWDLAHLVGRLRDQQHRLDELAAGQRSVTAALDLSYHDLGIDQQRAYRLLGLHPGADIDVYAAAALLDTTLVEAGRLLEQLLEAHLLQEPVTGRYRFHDLTRAHAARTASRNDTEHGGAATDRLLDYYRHTTAVAMDIAYPYERGRRPQVPPAHTPSPALSDPAPALAWLDAELPNLLAAAGYAAEHHRPEYLLHLSTILHWHLRSHGRLRDAVTLHQQALSYARAIGHQAAALEALVGLGNIHQLQGRHEQATDHYRQALQLARATRHRPGEMDALIGLGHIYRMQDRHEAATDHYQQALRLARATGHRPGELDALFGLGRIRVTLGRYEQATDEFQQALRLARATNHRPGELNALSGLGHIHRMQRRYEQAIDHFERAGQLARATGHDTGELNALTGLGQVSLMQGRYQQANAHYQRLLDLARQSGNRNYEFEARQGLGRLQHATGHPDAALTYHHRALALASELGQPNDEVRAHDGIAHAHHMLHQHEQARAHWQHALDILTRLGLDDTDDEETTAATIHTHLANLDLDERTAPKNTQYTT